MQRNRITILGHLKMQLIVCSLFLSSTTVPFTLAAYPSGDTADAFPALDRASSRARQPIAQEQRASPVEKRRREREALWERERRAREQAILRRQALKSQKREQRLGALQERREERMNLREGRAGLPDKRKGYDRLRQAILDAVNRERALRDLPLLTANKNLEMSAQLHAEDMLVRGFFDHFTPEGLSHVDRIRNAGYLNRDGAFRMAVGENLAKGQRSVNWAMNEWMASPSHRENILSPSFKEMGVGIAEGAEESGEIFGRIWVQNFGGIEVTE